MNIILFDTARRLHLLPFTHTRPIADIRCGIFTMRERWEHLLASATGTLTAPYLQELFPLRAGTDNVYINGAIFGTQEMAAAIKHLEPGHKLVKGDTLIAFRIHEAVTLHHYATAIQSLPEQYFDGSVSLIDRITDIFSLNDQALRNDYHTLTRNRKSQPIPNDVTVRGEAHVFIEEGAVINAGCIINATTGPVYIAKDAEILEGCIIRGPLALGEHVVIKMGAKIYGATTIGRGSKVGGEISNCVFFANSNKGHDGFLGNAVVGEWCNLGADTNCSNLKNNYDEVKIWDEHNNQLVRTGLTFCGLLMGDHSKCGINTMFNTGTVVGVSCNLFGSNFPDKFVPSFSWGGSDKQVVYDFKKAIETATRVMKRRSITPSQAEIDMLQAVFNQTAEIRNLHSVH